MWLWVVSTHQASARAYCYNNGGVAQILEQSLESAMGRGEPLPAGDHGALIKGWPCREAAHASKASCTGPQLGRDFMVWIQRAIFG